MHFLHRNQFVGYPASLICPFVTLEWCFQTLVERPLDCLCSLKATSHSPLLLAKCKTKHNISDFIYFSEWIVKPCDVFVSASSEWFCVAVFCVTEWRLIARRFCGEKCRSRTTNSLQMLPVKWSSGSKTAPLIAIKHAQCSCIAFLTEYICYVITSNTMVSYFEDVSTGNIGLILFTDV